MNATFLKGNLAMCLFFKGALKYACPFALEIPLLGIYPEEIMKNVHKYLPTRKLIFGTVYRSEKLKTLNVQ